MTDRPNLAGAILAQVTEREAAATAAAAPAHDAFEARIEAEAALYGTAGWDALSPQRRQFIASRVALKARTAQGGAGDAA